MGRKNNGFTLTELLISVAIIGTLAVMLISSLKPSTQFAKARDSTRRADINKISKALEEYLNDHNCYPTVEEMSCNPGTGLIPYLDKIPCDPETGESYLYVPGPNVCNQYAIYANLETVTNMIYGSFNLAVSSPNLSLVPTILLSPTGTLGGQQPTITPTPQQFAAYGCKSGVCVGLPVMNCAPNYDYPSCGGSGNCDNPDNECQ